MLKAQNSEAPYLAVPLCQVSIPNGRPRPVSLSCLSVTITVSAGEFQSLTGVPGQLALARRYRFLTAYRVSIPNGRPRLFSPRYDYRQKHDCYSLQLHLQNPGKSPGMPLCCSLYSLLLVPSTASSRDALTSRAFLSWM